MSATINQEQFIKYFGGAPAIEIPGFTHPVEDLYVTPSHSSRLVSNLIALVSYLEDYLPKLQYRAETPRFKIKQTEDQKTALKTWLDSLDVDNNTKQSLEALSITSQIPYDLIAAVVAHIEATSVKPDDGVLIL
jgi:ATP-dependent RNA helicase DHX57